MHVQMENRRKGQHKDLRFKLQSFLDIIVNDMLDSSCSVTISRAAHLANTHRSTTVAWLAELEAYGQIELNRDLIIVRGVVFEDLR